MGENLQAFRDEVRAWLTANAPVGWREKMAGADGDGFVAFQREWFAALAPSGYATPHWEKGWVGGGRSLAEQVVIFEEMARADAPRLLLHFISLYHAAMTISHWGRDDQKRRHLPAIIAGSVWCQGFSEPNAGSDLASLRTRAERKGDRYIVNGQKIWSTMGQYADWCLLLVRTSTDGPKQAGITYLLMDMKSKGVVPRPIRQITGDEEFNEVFLEDVEVPVENRLGEEGEGWKVAQTTLSSERGLTILELAERMNRALWRLMEALASHGRNTDAQFRREAVGVQLRIDALRAMLADFMARSEAGSELVGASSMIKHYYAQTLREFTQLGLRAQGLPGQEQSPMTLGGGHETGNWMVDFLNSYMWTIAGGTNEIQRTIISERVLKMPREKLS
ncbi:MAG: acyl-CoA dehydrogenase family protein [Rhizobiales bacterium]|nr:acyl-CoA dehydrogenase family protein [Hyphomicrobiales bacterium]